MAATTRRRLRRIIRTTAVTMIVLFVAVAATLLVLVRTEPAHWKAHQEYLRTHTLAQRTEDAARVEQRILALTQLFENETEAAAAVSTDDALALAADAPVADKPVTRELHLNQHELNAWIAEKFYEWMTYRDYVMPDEINDPMVAIDNGKLTLSFELRAGDFRQVFSAGFDVTLRKDDMAVLELRNVMAGNLSIPSDGIGDYLRRYGPDDARIEKIAGWLNKLDRLEFKPSMKVGDTHKARVVDYVVVEDGVDVTLELEPRPSYIARRETIASVPTDDQ